MSEIISWDKAIDKKVKSSDDKDLGKVQSITRDYIKTKEGSVSKNYYFIPKYYMQGYDGDNIWVSLTKDEAKSRFEKEKEPNPSEFETPEYTQRRTAITQQHPDFENSIPTYRGAVAATQSADTSQAMVSMPWDKLIDKKVKSSNKQDLGTVESVSTNYVEVKEGHLAKKHYYIPKYYIEGFDGENLHASFTKSEIKDRYQRDSPPSESEFKTQELDEQRRRVESKYPQFSHGVPFMTKEPGVTITSGKKVGAGETSVETLNIPWEEVIHKRVRTSDNVDVGDIETVGNEFIAVREGDVKIHHYYIPKVYITGYDGSSLWISVPSSLVSAKFEKETEPTPEEIRMMSREAEAKRKP